MIYLFAKIFFFEIVDILMNFDQGILLRRLAERVTQTLKFTGQLPKKTTEMQQLPHQRQAEILGLLLGGHTIQNRTRLSSGNKNF